MACHNYLAIDYSRGKEFDCNDKADMTTALLAASKRYHSNIVKCILLADSSVMPKATEKMNDLACAFQVQNLNDEYQLNC